MPDDERAAEHPTEARSSGAAMVHQRAAETQAYGQITRLPIALKEKTCAAIVEMLNQVLADTMTLRDMYKKHHWQVSGATFYPLHLLYDKHYAEQVLLVDIVAERIQVLGGISLAMAADVAEVTCIARPPRGREEVPVQLSRLLEAHEAVISETRSMAAKANDLGDLGSNDVLVSNVLRTNELQVWFLTEHLVSTPLTKAS